MKERKKTKICVYCDKWGSGGIESFLLNVLEKMNTADFEIDIVVSELESNLYAPRLKALKIDLIVLSGRWRAISENHCIFRKVLKTKKYDVVYINIYHALSFLYALDAQKIGIASRIVHSHNNGLRASYTKPIKLLIHHLSKVLFSRYATEYLACSQQAADFMFNKNTNYKWIPNGIDLQKFTYNEAERSRVRKELGIDDKFVIGNIGRLCYQKNQVFSIEICAALVKMRTEAVLLLVGDGEDEDSLKKMASRMGIQDKVFFYGTTNEVEQLYWAMDVFLFPSHFEGLGIVAIEAQATGLPVICSNHVPTEANVTDFIEFLPIDRGIDPWVKRLFGSFARKDVLGQVKLARYDINDVVGDIKKLWLCKRHTE